jgi:hypothetical protein
VLAAWHWVTVACQSGIRQFGFKPVEFGNLLGSPQQIDEASAVNYAKAA